MASPALSKHDFGVLEKIKDPESDPSLSVLVDPMLPRDPHFTDPEIYKRLSQREQSILLSIQRIELELEGLKPQSIERPEQEYRACIEELDSLIDEFPNYASARNNRAQAMRRLYGGNVLICRGGSTETLSSRKIDDEEATIASGKILWDLDEGILLLTPSSPFAAVSTQQAKTLSLLHTQRAAIYHEASKMPPEAKVCLDSNRKEVAWSRLQLEEAASRDFALGGKYGCEIAKGLAVSTNPTAKLCGQMVREAMKKEYGSEYAT